MHKDSIIGIHVWLHPPPKDKQTWEFVRSYPGSKVVQSYPAYHTRPVSIDRNTVVRIILDSAMIVTPPTTLDPSLQIEIQ